MQDKQEQQDVEVTVDEAVELAERREALEKQGTLGVRLIWSKRGPRPEQAMVELAKLKSEAALTGDVKVGPCSDSARLQLEIDVALLNAEISKGDGLTELAEAKIAHAVKKRHRRRLRARAQSQTAKAKEA